VSIKPCYVFWHKWSKWKLVSAGNLQETFDKLTGNPLTDDGSPAIIGRFAEQIRVCDRCGAVQLRIARA
jgi:hypothetical protein